jgi:hypothetical protein
MGFFGFGKKKKNSAQNAGAAADPNAPAPPPPFIPDAQPNKQDIASMEKNSVFSKQELSKLKTRYQSLADEETGRVDKISFCSMPELACCATFVKLCMDKEFKEVGGGGRGGGDRGRRRKTQSYQRIDPPVSYPLTSSSSFNLYCPPRLA